MKLAEALSVRSSLMEKAHLLKTHLKDCVKVQEGDTPVDNATQVIEQLNSTLAQLTKIITQINITNLQTIVDGKSLTALLAERDTLKMKVRALGDSLSHLTERIDIYHRNEVRYVRTVDCNEFRHIHDEAAAHLRLLDLKIQSIGWTTNLIEK